jgi:NACalpha-BTF3-like transcription factor
MKVTLEMIDELRSRVNVTYEEAKEALENNEGDIVQAIIELEKNKKNYHGHRRHRRDNVNNNANRVLSKFLSTDFVLRKKDKVYLNLPFWMVALLVLITLPFSLIALVLFLLLGYQMRIVTARKTKFDINKNVDKMTRKFKETTDKIFEESDEMVEESSEDTDDEEDEITIE